MSQQPETYADAFNLLCGDEIGRGVHRTVFECRIRPEFVVKVEDGYNRYFANVKEMALWSEMEHQMPTAKWLAPCEYMSPDGRILLQRRCDPVPQGYQMPDKMPGFLSDFKRCNFGMLDGRLVCMDYAMTIPNPSLRLRKVNW